MYTLLRYTLVMLRNGYSVDYIIKELRGKMPDGRNCADRLYLLVEHEKFLKLAAENLDIFLKDPKMFVSKNLPVTYSLSHMLYVIDELGIVLNESEPLLAWLAMVIGATHD